MNGNNYPNKLYVYHTIAPIDMIFIEISKVKKLFVLNRYHLPFVLEPNLVREALLHGFLNRYAVLEFAINLRYSWKTSDFSTIFSSFLLLMGSQKQYREISPVNSNSSSQILKLNCIFMLHQWLWKRTEKFAGDEGRCSIESCMERGIWFTQLIHLTLYYSTTVLFPYQFKDAMLAKCGTMHYHCIVLSFELIWGTLQLWQCFRWKNITPVEYVER